MQRFQVYACITTIVLIIWALLFSTVSRSSMMRIKESYNSIPMNIASWKGENRITDAKTFEMLTTASILTRDYSNDTGDGVNLSIVYAQNIGDIHQPERCMEGTGFKRIRKAPVWVTPKDSSKHRATMVVFSDDLGNEVVMIYWFYIDGRIMPNMSKKTSALWHSMWSGTKPCSMIKYTTSSITGEESAKKVALAFASNIDSRVLELVKGTPKFEPSNLAIERAKASAN